LGRLSFVRSLDLPEQFPEQLTEQLPKTTRVGGPSRSTPGELPAFLAPRILRGAGKLFRSCSEVVRRLLGSCSEVVRKVFGSCSEVVRKLFGSCSEVVRKLFGRLFGSCSGSCSGVRLGSVFDNGIKENLFFGLSEKLLGSCSGSCSGKLFGKLRGQTVRTYQAKTARTTSE